MAEFLLEYGLISLFIVSFGASTLLPLGSEWLLVALLLSGSQPGLSVLVATLGNSLGSGTNYLIGSWSSNWLTHKLLRIDNSQQQRAELWFKRFGSWSLLLAWLPIIGDPLCVIAGTLKTPITRFFLLVTTGKALRYLTVALLTLQGAEIFA
ncbi:MAG: DedA family protein [Deltaproteobacteria bacterium]|nr:DedA family protein [Deltaproteobacteria bacterium]MCW8891825.1 DedA family protein [Deltaproteobacteria bacterium]MCW9049245.1 DedA family protein [Deltaproteobacteria bacterium]